MLSKQEEEQERREVLENDRRVREQQQQTGTFFSHGVSQALDTAGGRFGATGAPTVTGATPVPSYPAAGVHHSDPVGTEPPLGFSVDQVEPSMGTTRPIEDTGGAAAPSCPSGVEPAPPPSSEQTNE